ncbi:putative phage replication initiation protein (Alteromonas phage PM2) [Vibrio crassostreae]|uniref:replication endonuclease n=1 Tax=Vibrio crassostreae TaxID=246167 RepID=UPI001B303AD0|nr:putative phage replication initiation protein (Alteromonas phage PM2) [Vibrio crassostreae]CAK1812547.1 putative phage replication initiation protein (Alteromonas phage PM2) [Vibrio crassostreae]CAK1816165.1 putative phage replication initiation protein (Alteromonas phage PM2) [Vibrio crassostreae]CAK2287406.1 putative phage replication initiation protein (Alteromonas phage PM2) [Vibrio crassostreae]CAK2287699.1 putative phage replication initiation protein (Alteromonas phage PM2) [Vibrio cr
MHTLFAREFMPRLPRIVQDDVRFQVSRRKRRTNATPENIDRFTNDSVKHALKCSPFIEDKYTFVDERSNAPERQRLHSGARSSVELNHSVLMCDEALEHLATNLTEMFTRLIQMIEIEESESGYLDALEKVFYGIREDMKRFYIKAPQIKKKHETREDAERELERAIRRCLDVNYLVRKFKFLRTQYIEYSQIALSRVGGNKGQRKYVSSRSYARWEKKQIEAEQFVNSMSVINDETGQAFDLSEVVKRTTANPENRRIELVVRSRGDEERAIDLGYEGVFVNWTLPSKYHRNSDKWNGCTPKEAHEVMMAKWRCARAWFKKPKIDIQWFGLRVAEPHKDGTPHAHMFLYVHPAQKQDLIDIIEGIAIDEDKSELIINGKLDKTPRITIKDCDPSQGTATGYIIKYISKNINGAHMPEGDAKQAALSATAWARIHRIKQFSQSGAPSVGLWRQLRRASPLDTAFDEELEALRDHADNSRWKGFCELGFKAKLAYEEKFNQYGDAVKRVIGINWLGKVIATCSEQFSLVKTKDVKRRALDLKKGGALPWSTENKCNQPEEIPISPLEQALIDVTGWSVKGIQCLLKPLSVGATVPIDKHLSLRLRNGRLITT